VFLTDLVRNVVRRVVFCRAWSRGRGVFVLCAAATVVDACRKDLPPLENMEASAAPGTEAGDAADAGEDDGRTDDAAGLHARDLEARAEARRDAGSMDPACEGRALSLFAVALDDRCATSEREYARLASEKVDGGSAARRLKQEARLEDARLVFSIVNSSPEAAPCALPIRVSPERSSAFSVLAENARGEVFELAAPKLDPEGARVADAGAPRRRLGQARLSHDPTRDGGLPGLVRVHTSVIRLLPDGRATVKMTIDPAILARLAPRGPAQRPCSDAGGGDGGNCLPAQLPKGRYTLYVGQLLSEIDTGPPAQVVWDAP
jgi:hypothetical protein